MDNLTNKELKKVGKRYEVSVFEDKLVESGDSLRKKSVKKQKSSLLYIGYVGQLGFVIAIPIAGGAALGSYGDTRWNTYPKMTMIGLCIGIGISIINFIAVIKEIIRDSTK